MARTQTRGWYTFADGTRAWFNGLNAREKKMQANPLIAHYGLRPGGENGLPRRFAPRNDRGLGHLRGSFSRHRLKSCVIARAIIARGDPPRSGGRAFLVSRPAAIRVLWLPLRKGAVSEAD